MGVAQFLAPQKPERFSELAILLNEGTVGVKAAGGKRRRHQRNDKVDVIQTITHLYQFNNLFLNSMLGRGTNG